MKTLLIVAASLLMVACSTVQQQALLNDIQGCTRHYDGAMAAGVIGGANFTGTVKIDCDPKVVADTKP